MTALQIAEGFSLPVDYVTKTVAILAQRRKGKTYAASVIAEELVAAGQPFVVLDPTGAWWGLRADADAVSPGIPVTILGGDHGDVPLERTDGKGVAELVVDEPGWYIVDFSLFESNAAEVQFASDFAQRIYRRKGQPNSDFPLHIFVDEADRFVPQKPTREKGEGSVTTMLGAFEAIVRRGGLRGLGTTLISQRSAVVNKNVLEQADLFVILRTVGPNDRKRIEEIVSAEGTQEQIAELKASMASLELGEAWVWEPGEGVFARIHIRQRRTFNSSATPKPGEKRVEPRQLAPVDLEAIKERWSAQIEKVKADDPKELRKQIAELKRELSQRPTVEPERIEVPVEVGVPTPFVPGEVIALLTVAQEHVTHALAAAEGIPMFEVPKPKPRAAPPRPAPAARLPRPAPTTAPVGDVDGLGKGEWKVLHVLSEYPEGRTQNQVAFLAGYSAKASTIGVILSKLRKSGLVERDQPIRLSPEGFDLVPVVVQPTGDELLAKWYAHSRIGEGERKVLDVLIDAWPDSLTHDDLCERTGYSPSASTIGVILSKLRKLGLAQKGRRALDADFAESIGA